MSRQPDADAGSGLPSSPTQRLWFLDFLRALSAVAIAAYHLGYFFWIYNELGPTLWLAKPIPNLHVASHIRHFKEFIDWSHLDPGQASVSIFFLVSGFVIPLALERCSRKDFLISRLLRIYPTYWCALAFTCSCLAASASLNGRQFAYSLRDLLFNLTLCHDWVGGPLIDGVSWTLVIEIKFYILCALLYAFRDYKRPTLLLSVAGFLTLATFAAEVIYPFCVQSGSPWTTSIVVVLTNASRLIFILIGMTIYRLWQRQWTGKVFLCTATILTVLYSIAATIAQLRSPGECNTAASYLLGAIIFCLVFLLRDKIPRIGAIQFMADISYPFYLVHSFAGCAILSAVFPYTHNIYLDLLLTVPVVLAAAILIHKLVELPSFRLAKRLRLR